jgi:hypothetical protein
MAGFLRVLPKSSFKKLLLGTGLWHHAKMSTSLSPDGLKNVECKKGQLSHRPPILYIPMIDIVTPEEETQVFKIKLPDMSHLSMSIYSSGNIEEYLAHIVAVFQVIEQKGLPKKCQVLAMAVARQSKALNNLQEAAESRDTNSTSVDVTACKVEIEQTHQILQEAQKAHDKAIAESYEQLGNLLSGNAQSQWDCICRKMHERDLWAAVNGQVTKGRRPRMWMSFLDCLKLHKLTVFSADAAKKQRFYIQQAVRKPQRATVRQHILRMGVLNDCVKHLPMLKDSSKAVPTTKKGNIPFGKADLATIVLLSVPMLWQNQYNLNHSTVPKSTSTLLPVLEAIKQVMVEKKGANLKVKGKGSTAPSKAKGNPKRKASGGPTSRVPKKGRSEKFCQWGKAHGGPFMTHNTLNCRRYDSNGKPLKAAAGKPSESKKPYKKSGGNKGTAFMQSLFEAYVKSQKKAGKSKKHKIGDYDSSDSSDSE